jgi:hypothetical protein
MIIQLFKLAVCKFKTHTLVAAGACPVTGKSYNACTRCGGMIAI